LNCELASLTLSDVFGKSSRWQSC